MWWMTTTPPRGSGRNGRAAYASMASPPCPWIVTVSAGKASYGIVPPRSSLLDRCSLPYGVGLRPPGRAGRASHGPCRGVQHTGREVVHRAGVRLVASGLAGAGAGPTYQPTAATGVGRGVPEPSRFPFAGGSSTGWPDAVTALAGAGPAQPRSRVSSPRRNR